MSILTHYDIEALLRHNYHDTDLAIKEMKKAIKIYWRNRKNKIARSRIKSAISIIRQLQH